MQPNHDSGEKVSLPSHHYALENERQHTALMQRITGFETHLVRWIVGSMAMFAGAVVALSQLLDN